MFRSVMGLCAASCALLVSCGGASKGVGDGSNAAVGPGGGDGTVTGPNGNGGGSAVDPGTPAVGSGAGAGPLAPGEAVADEGIVVLRRLNRFEYNNTTRDLLGTALTLADTFPADGVAEGFNTVGEALSVSALHLERYEAAATALVDELFARPAGPERSAILTCELTAGNETACTEQVLTAFASRAFRRPATPEEVSRLTSLASGAVAEGATAEEALRAGLTAVLISPQFIYRVEREPAIGAAIQPVSTHELATRLSYFLWGSMPDEALLSSAGSGALINDAELATQSERLLADSRASALVQGFARQWFGLDRLSAYQPDPLIFPDFNLTVLDSGQQETELFFQTLITENLPLEAMLVADFGFVNAELAQHYGIAGSGNVLARASLAGSPRVGFLTQVGFLAATSHPHRTSPVRRGNWVLSQLLCAPLPPPPPDVPPLDSDDMPTGTSQRARLEVHRQNAACAVCHSLMDPIGLGLENFDAVGRYRELEDGLPIDASGVLPDGTAFVGAAQMAPLVAQDPRFASCVTEKLLTYGVGRTFLTPEARQYTTALSAQLTASGQGNWQTWLSNLTLSEAFRTRRTQGL